MNLENQNIKLLTDSKLRENPVFEDCLYHCFETNEILCSNKISSYYTQFFEAYHYYLNQNGYEKIKIVICKILKYMAIYNSSKMSEQLIYDLFNTLNFYANSGIDSIFSDEFICECLNTCSILRTSFRSFCTKKDVLEYF